MRIERHDDPADFFARVAPFLERREAEHNLLLGFRGRLEADRHAFGPADPLLLAVVDDTGQVCGVATQTPPFGLVLSELDDAAIPALLAERLAADGAALPTALGPVRAVKEFVERWATLANVVPRVGVEQRIYEATEVAFPAGVPGSMRPYEAADRKLAIEWLERFAEEATPGALPDVERLVDERAAGVGSLVLWEDGGRVVSLAGQAGETPNGSRVGPVYTPPELRGRGYASALTAALTAELLQRRRFCFLFTDLANATSNSIYQRIGYRPVTDVTAWRFDPA